MHAFMSERMHECVRISINLHVFGLEIQLIELAEALGRTRAFTEATLSTVVHGSQSPSLTLHPPPFFLY